MTDEPLVIYSDAYLDYDFGPDHPLTPRRFGPSIALMRATGATNFAEPRLATDDELERLHTASYIRTVKNFGTIPGTTSPTAGIGPGDCPPFENMHEASATVAGGSISAVDRVLAGQSEHAFNPGGGLHHAMAGRASGFCIYNDVALAVARARDAGHRVLYVDLDVHHGDGTQALFWDDPQVLTFSIHETGMTLFPGTGYVDETAARRARHCGQHPAPAVQRRRIVDRGRRTGSAGPRHGVRADLSGDPARLRHARVRPARSPAAHD